MAKTDEEERKQPTLQERVVARSDSLTATERRVARYLSEHPQHAAFASAEEIARATGTSDASVIRTAKALGFDGLPGLKRSLQGHLGALLTPANRLQNAITAFHDGPEGVLAATLAERADLIEDIGRTIDPAAFRRAVEVVRAAHETVVCGIGGHAGVAEHTATRLVRFGYRARHASATGFALADCLMPLGPDDAVVLIAHNRLMREMRVTLDHAARVGARVVLLTETLGEALRDRAEVVLSAPMGRPGTYGGLTTTLIVLEALTMAVAAQDQDRSMKAITGMNQLREELVGHPFDEEPFPGGRAGKAADGGPRR